MKEKNSTIYNCFSTLCLCIQRDGYIYRGEMRKKIRTLYHVLGFEFTVKAI